MAPAGREQETGVAVLHAGNKALSLLETPALMCLRQCHGTARSRQIFTSLNRRRQILAGVVTAPRDAEATLRVYFAITPYR